MDYLKKLEEEFQPFTETVRETLAGLDHEITRLQDELLSLREARKRVRALQKQLDPESASQNGKSKKAHEFSQQKLREFTDWLIENRDRLNEGPGFYAGSLYDDPTFTLVGDKSRIAKALALAHEHGVIRLDSIGRGGRKNFKVVT